MQMWREILNSHVIAAISANMKCDTASIEHSGGWFFLWWLAMLDDSTELVLVLRVTPSKSE